MVMLASFAPGAGVDEMVAAMNRDGAIILSECVSDETVEAVKSELRPYFDSEGTGHQSSFNGYDTLRLCGILARSRTSAELIGFSSLLAIVDAILLPHCINYRIGSLTGIEIWPGESPQTLHRDDGIYPTRIPGMEWHFIATALFYLKYPLVGNHDHRRNYERFEDAFLSGYADARPPPDNFETTLPIS